MAMTITEANAVQRLLTLLVVKRVTVVDRSTWEAITYLADRSHAVLMAGRNGQAMEDELTKAQQEVARARESATNRAVIA